MSHTGSLVAASVCKGVCQMVSISSSVGKSGVNRSNDVRAIQGLLNNHRKLKISVDGAIGPQTIQAIEEFQKNVVRMQRPDGRVDVGGNTLRALNSPAHPGHTQPPAPAGHLAGKPNWIAIAQQEIGIKEQKGMSVLWSAKSVRRSSCLAAIRAIKSRYPPLLRAKSLPTSCRPTMTFRKAPTI